MASIDQRARLERYYENAKDLTVVDGAHRLGQVGIPGDQNANRVPSELTRKLEQRERWDRDLHPRRPRPSFVMVLELENCARAAGAPGARYSAASQQRQFRELRELHDERSFPGAARRAFRPGHAGSRIRGRFHLNFK
jgi:hypothetical protein